MKSSRTLVHAAGWAAAGNAVVKAQGLALSLVGARALSLTQFGALMSWIGILYIFVVLADFGLAGFLQRHVASRAVQSSRIVQHLLTVQCVTIMPFITCCVLAILVFHPSRSLGWVAVLLLVCWIELSLVNGILSAALVGNLNFRASTTAVSIGRAAGTLMLLVLAFLCTGIASPATIALSLLLAEVVGFVAQMRALPAQTWGGLQSVGQLMRRLVPYMLNNFANSSYSRGDTPIVSATVGNHGAGLYAPASQMQSLLLSVVTVLNSGTIAVIARQSVDQKLDSSTRRLVRSTLTVSVLAGGLAAIGVVIAARWLILAVYGPAFDGTVAVLQVIVISVPIAAVHVVLSQALVAVGRASAIATGTLVALVVGLVCLLVFSYLWGPIGAACGIITRDVVLSVYCAVVWRGSRELPRKTPGKTRRQGSVEGLAQ